MLQPAALKVLTMLPISAVILYWHFANDKLKRKMFINLSKKTSIKEHNYEVNNSLLLIDILTF